MPRYTWEIRTRGIDLARLMAFLYRNKSNTTRSVPIKPVVLPLGYCFGTQTQAPVISLSLWKQLKGANSSVAGWDEPKFRTECLIAFEG